MMPLRMGLIFLITLSCLSYPGSVAIGDQPPEFGLLLKHGSILSGKLLPNKHIGHIALQCEAFAEPVEFDVNAIGSIYQRGPEPELLPSESLFTLSNGSTLAGKLLGLDEQEATIQSPCFGQVRIPRPLLISFGKASIVGKQIYSGPRNSTEWTTAGPPASWKMEGGVAMTTQAGASLNGDVKLPVKSQIDLSLSLPASPNFELALGCAKVQTPAEKVRAALQLEIWDGSLVMVRDAGGVSDFVVLPLRPGQDRRLDLRLFLDQENGLAAAYTSTGRRLARLELKAPSATSGSFVHLGNYGTLAADERFCLERFDVHEWDGRMPDQWPETESGLLDEEGHVHAGRIGQLDAARRALSIIDESGNETSMPLEKIRRALFRTPDKLQDRQASVGSLELFLADRSQVVGRLAISKTDEFQFELDGFEEAIAFSTSHIVSGHGNDAEFDIDLSPGRRGELKTAAATLTGFMSESDGVGSLRWHAHGALSAGGLSPRCAGEIEYEPISAPPKPVHPTLERAGMNGIVIRNGIIAGNAAGAGQFMLGAHGNVIRTGVFRQTVKKLEIGLKFRNGDEISGQVKSIDERGVTFSSDETTTTFVPHDQMDSISLVDTRYSGLESPEKLKRLMTVPRAAKSDPPTHLVVSASGDYLRCRLIDYDGQRLVAEVRSEDVELPASEIAQLFWLHSRDWETAQEVAPASADSVLQVHAVQKAGKSMTFVPTGFSQHTLRGKSELLGDCGVGVDSLCKILFGTDVGQQARELREQAWKLSLAALPKVYQEGEGDDARNRSPMVGQVAPEFALPTAAGGQLALAELRGRVVVLDFWASWCGPCMQTMPEVERIVKEVGEAEVDLIAVNIQETKERISAAVKRLELSATVVLDSEGETAHQYQATAIPQTVIIDREGIVTDVFIGGGPRFLKDFAEALKKALEK